MDELKLNDRITTLYNNKTLSGRVVLIEYDRVTIQFEKNDIEYIKNIQELEELQIDIHTYLGIKKMNSAVIDNIASLGKIIVENNETEFVDQKRKFVRVVCEFDAKIKKDNRKYTVKALNISSGGFAFKAQEKLFQLGDEVIVILPEEVFGKSVECEAKIVKMNELNYAIKYNNLSVYNENLIMKYVFKVISENKKSQE